MLHERIEKTPRTAAALKARYHFVRSGWGAKRKRWLHLYRVYPPASKPYLPSDEAIKTLVATVPGIRLHECIRFIDHDLFLVYGRNKNIFTTRAGSDARAIRNGFLSDVAAMAIDTRDTPTHVQEAAKTFLADCGFVYVEWNGAHAIAYNANGKRYEGLRVGGTYWRPFRTFEHICKPILPFTYSAAPS